MSSKDTITIPREEYDKFISQGSEIESLKHQLSELQRMIFGAKRERFVPTDSNQGSLFDLPGEQLKPEPKEEISYTILIGLHVKMNSVMIISNSSARRNHFPF